MLHFGPAGIPAACRTHEEGVEEVARVGLSALEIEFVHGVRMDPAEAARIGRLAAKKGILLSAHAPYYINLNSEKAEIIDRSRRRIVDSLRLARELGARIVVVHAGYYSGRASPEATRVILEGIRECREQADREGCTEVVLGLETMGRRASWGTLDEMLEVCPRVKGVWPVLDFAHIHARGGGCLVDAEAFRDLLERFERFGAPFLHCHFSGVEFGRAGERRHLEVRARSPDFALLAPLLLRKRYDITLICESPLPEQDALVMKGMAEEAVEGAQGSEGARVRG